MVNHDLHRQIEALQNLLGSAQVRPTVGGQIMGLETWTIKTTGSKLSEARDALALLTTLAEQCERDRVDAARWRVVERNPYSAYDRIFAAIDSHKPSGTWAPAARAALDATIKERK